MLHLKVFLVVFLLLFYVLAVYQATQLYVEKNE